MVRTGLRRRTGTPPEVHSVAVRAVPGAGDERGFGSADTDRALHRLRPAGAHEQLSVAAADDGRTGQWAALDVSHNCLKEMGMPAQVSEPSPPPGIP